MIDFYLSMGLQEQMTVVLGVFWGVTGIAYATYLFATAGRIR